MILSLLIAATTFSAVIPPEPELWNKPDSVLFYSGGKLQGSTALTYNSDGYLTKMTITESSIGELSTTAKYTKNNDTLTSINSYSDGSDDTKSSYIIDQSSRVIKCISYENNQISEIDSFVYKNEKIVKTIITNPVSGTNSGDSIVYTYDQNGLLSSSKQYGSSGEIWAYAEFETDASGRVTKGYYFDCEDGCVKTEDVTDFRYTDITKIRRYSEISHSGSYSLKVSSNNLTVIMQNGSQLKSLGLYDLKGNKISSIAIGNRTSGEIDIGNLTPQFYLVRIETRNGLMSRKVFISRR